MAITVKLLNVFLPSRSIAKAEKRIIEIQHLERALETKVIFDSFLYFLAFSLPSLTSLIVLPMNRLAGAMEILGQPWTGTTSVALISSLQSRMTGELTDGNVVAGASLPHRITHVLRLFLSSDLSPPFVLLQVLTLCDGGARLRQMEGHPSVHPAERHLPLRLLLQDQNSN